jgi:biotin transporter BioY
MIGTLLRLLILIPRFAVLAALAFVALLVTAAPSFAADAVQDSPGTFADTAAWGLIAGVLAPLLISVVQQPRWSGRTRVAVHVAASVAIGLLTCLANGTLDSDAQTVLSVVALVLVSSSATYGRIFKPSGVSAAIENKTSPSSRTA